MKEFNSKISAMAAASSSGELNAPARVNNDPLSIHGDGEQLLPQSSADYLVIEVMEGSKNSVGLIARAMSQPECWYGGKGKPKSSNAASVPNTNQAAGDTGHGASGKARNGRRSPKKGASQGKTASEGDSSTAATELDCADAVVKGKDALAEGLILDISSAEDPKTNQKIWNATSRRRGAFRRGLVRCVMLAHDAYLQRRGGEESNWDPLLEGKWHKDFPLASLSTGEALEMAEEAAAQLALAEQSGRVKYALDLSNVLHMLDSKQFEALN